MRKKYPCYYQFIELLLTSSLVFHLRMDPTNALLPLRFKAPCVTQTNQVEINTIAKNLSSLLRFYHFQVVLSHNRPQSCVFLWLHWVPLLRASKQNTHYLALSARLLSTQIFLAGLFSLFFIFFSGRVCCLFVASGKTIGGGK